MKRRLQQTGFSLVEVVLALGITAFCLLTIFALLPIGLKTNQETLQETTAASLAAAVSTDLRATSSTGTTSPYFGLPVSSASTNNIYVTDAGEKLTAPSGSQATYLATVVFTPASATMNAASARILITWPALPGQVNGAIPTQYLGSYNTVIGLDRNY